MITATASVNVGVSRVEFYDGATLKGTATAPPYTFAWPVSSASNGLHSWTAKAYDAAGNNATSTAVSVTVNIAVVGTPTLVGFVPGVGEVKAVGAGGGLAFLASDPFGLSVVN